KIGENKIVDHFIILEVSEETPEDEYFEELEMEEVFVTYEDATTNSNNFADKDFWEFTTTPVGDWGIYRLTLE
ncbi:MAG: hypothetical protein AAF985_13575, partial [Bacteroidota bacterium]